MNNLQKIAVDAINKIDEILVEKFTEEQREQVADIVERAIIKGMLEGQHRAVDAALHFPEADQDIAHKIANAIRRKNDVLIANLSSLR